MPENVAILMGTYNGAEFLAEQLDSIHSQTHQDWKLYVSDDGSSDKTLEILNHYAAKWGPDKIQILKGPRQGFVENFSSMIKHPDIQADYFAFSDQDDVWHPDKLEIAIAWLKSQNDHRPALYCSRLRLINSSGAPIGLSQHNPRPPSFRNALVENVASGNATVMNAPARDLLSRYMKPDLAVHDWAAYILVTAFGGTVFFDPIPHIDYRQHDRNIIGFPTGLPALYLRAKRVLSGTTRNWNTQNIALLAPLAAQLPPDQAKTFMHFQRMHGNNSFMQIFHLLMGGFYRQKLSGTIGLWLAALLAKI